MSEGALALSSRETIEVTQEQMVLARSTVAKGLDDDQFSLYIYNCKRQGIHPLDGLVIPIVRNDNEAGGKRLTFVSTVDLLRSRAAETNEYAGSDDSEFQYVPPAKNPQESKVTVWRFVQGQKCSFTATARWEEYYPGEKQGFMWRNKPHVMLGKCAEALALRKAFPKQLAGLYIPEELQRETPTTTSRQSETRKQQAPVGDTMCAECRAIGGHLPSCKYRKQTSAAPREADKEPAPPKKQETPTQTLEATDKPANEKMAVMIKTISERHKDEKDKAGKVTGKRSYIVLGVVDPNDNEWDLYVWHKTMQERVAGLGGKTALVEFSSKTSNGRTYCSLETVLEVVGESDANEEAF
jgi:phage recombination protein Bet